MAYIAGCPAGVIMPFAGLTAPDGWLLCDGAEHTRSVYGNLWSAFSLTLSCTSTLSSVNVTTADTSRIVVGAAVYGSFASGTYVTAITNATTFVVSAAATATGTANVDFALYDRQINPQTNVLWSAPTTGKFRVPDMRGCFLRGAGSPYQGDPVVLGGFQGHSTARNGLAGAATTVGTTTLGTSATHTHTGTTLNVSANHTHTGTIGNQSADHTHSGNSDYTNPRHNHQIPIGTLDDSNFSAGIGQNPPADGPGVSWTGSYVDFADINHRHSFTTGTVSANHNHGITVGNQSADHNHSFTSANQSADHTHTFSVAVTPNLATGDNETRPHNRGVQYIIKT